ncbi:hypothetical protein [Alteromonas sp. KUL49]|uniref:hypothetical protein n=1 Tax=Alteromonas sp. KUL49 TaxID=2480798 RepID=UPI00102F195E|nr:hypothetical protein [Alteromonas sp. KUL49]TAP38749.1 hypothetical protein EYS00_15210 [Alteromonas sp. KUL49]GEA12704.1 hypothetical protein KUL49_30790 [Alteromonas sp. KUL49]
MSQNDLFEQLDLGLLNSDNAPILDVEVEVIASIKYWERRTGLGRERFLDRINLCLRDTDKAVTKNQLNKWLSPSQENTVPAWVMPAICWALQTVEPLETLLKPIGFKTAGVASEILRQKAQADIQAKKYYQESKQLDNAISQMLKGRG